jgi:hypothetical protein
LYAPPGSGKSIARKVAFKIMKDVFGEQLDYSSLERTFIDTGIDEIAYDLKLGSDVNRTQDNMKSIFIEKLNQLLGRNDITDTNLNYILTANPDILTETIVDEIVEATYSAYIISKKEADPLSDSLKLFAIYLKYNIFIETSTWDDDYWNNLLSIMSHYKYIPIVLYPFTINTDLLYKRSVARGKKEYRFLQKILLHNLIKKDMMDYKKLKECIKNIFSDNYYFAVYDTDIDFLLFDKIMGNSQYEFGSDRADKSKLFFYYISAPNSMCNSVEIVDRSGQTFNSRSLFC